MSELDGVIALLLFVGVALVWLAVEVKRVHDVVRPLADSRIVQALARV